MACLACLSRNSLLVGLSFKTKTAPLYRFRPCDLCGHRVACKIMRSPPKRGPANHPPNHSNPLRTGGAAGAWNKHTYMIQACGRAVKRECRPVSDVPRRSRSSRSSQAKQSRRNLRRQVRRAPQGWGLAAYASGITWPPKSGQSGVLGARFIFERLQQLVRRQLHEHHFWAQSCHRVHTAFSQSSASAVRRGSSLRAGRNLTVHRFDL